MNFERWIYMCVCAHACYGLTCLQTLHMQALISKGGYLPTFKTSGVQWLVSFTHIERWRKGRIFLCGKKHLIYSLLSLIKSLFFLWIRKFHWWISVYKKYTKKKKTVKTLNCQWKYAKRKKVGNTTIDSYSQWRRKWSIVSPVFFFPLNYLIA